MHPNNFLKLVLSSNGWVCILGLKTGETPKQIFCRTDTEVADTVAELVDDERNVYFGCATYKDNKSRVQSNVQALRSFYLDLDCKPGKFSSLEDALEKLKEFVEHTGLPPPTTVKSGGGVHVYWPLTEDVPPEEWVVVAKALKKVCDDNKFYADPAITADIARVLRMPGTVNHKYNPVRVVEVIEAGEVCSFESFKEKLSAHVVTFNYAAVPAAAMQDGLVKGVQDPNAESWFKDILLKGGDDPTKGCAQLLNAVGHSAELDEPTWRAALSVAWRCEDRKQAVAAVSRGHPGYSVDGSNNKAAATAGPYTCEKFDGLVSGLCSSCTHKGKIKSPILLGRRIAEAPPAEEASGGDVVDTIPPLPAPYFRGKTGGIYRRGSGDDPPKLIYEYDFYVLDRIEDSVLGETIAFRAHFPNDGVKNFSIPLMLVTSKEELRKELSRQGMVLFGPKQMDEVMNYVGRWVKDLQTRRAATKSAYQFGWTKNYQSFVIGEEECTPTGVKYSPPSESTLQFVEFLRPKGELDRWKRVVDFYNVPGMEKYQFGICAGFGSIIYPFTGTDGGLLLSYESTESGHGKSYMVYVVNSIYGHPKGTVLGAKSTDNAIASRLGTWNNLPVHIDEVTKWSSDRMGDFVYAFNNGVGKARMQASVNSERLNRSTWRNISYMTSNSFVFTKLSENKAVPAGEMARVFPIRLYDPLLTSQVEADKIFALMGENYGLAGRVWIDYCVRNAASIARQVQDVKERIIDVVGFTHAHRFWSAGIAATLTAGAIAKRLGLIKFDMDKITDWVIHYSKEVMAEVETFEKNTVGSSVLGELFAENFSSTLLATKPDNKNTLTAIVLPKSNYLNIRIDPETGEVFIRSAVFNDHCKKYGYDPVMVKRKLAEEGIPFESTTCRLSAGTTIGVNAPTRVYKTVLQDGLVDDILKQVRDSNPASGAELPSTAV